MNFKVLPDRLHQDKGLPGRVAPHPQLARLDQAVDLPLREPEPPGRRVALVGPLVLEDCSGA